MASVSIKPNGRRMIQFADGDGGRRTIRLGKVSARAADAVRVKVESLLAARLTGHALDNETAQWLADLRDSFYAKLAAAGLVPARQAARLEAFLNAYLETRTDLKAGSKLCLGHTRRNLIEFFGADKPLRDIMEGDADEFRLHLVKAGLAENTIRKRLRESKQYFRAALRKGLIPKNPFADLGGVVRGNPERQYFVTRAEAEKVLAACPDAQWRLLFALSRYGGLRCPSEHLALTWQDVDWDKGRLTVHSPKTEHHEGKGSRQVPIFPELLPHLREAFEEAEPGAVHVISRYRDAKQNLRTQLTKIIGRAGLEPWPKLWHNLRATRETELAETYPLHVVCAWIGNSRLIAAEHYLQVTDEHFQRAASEPAEKALQKALQQAPEIGRNASQAKTPDDEKACNYRGLRADANPCTEPESVGMGAEGFEPSKA